jgi:hypothetical protein
MDPPRDDFEINIFPFNNKTREEAYNTCKKGGFVAIFIIFAKFALP